MYLWRHFTILHKCNTFWNSWKCCACAYFCKLCTSTTPWKYKINKLWCLFEKNTEKLKIVSEKKLLFSLMLWRIYWCSDYFQKKTWFCWFSIGCQWLSNEFDWFFCFSMTFLWFWLLFLFYDCHWINIFIFPYDYHWFVDVHWFVRLSFLFVWCGPEANCRIDPIGTSHIYLCICTDD